MYIMDTHAFLWFLADDEKLPLRMKHIILLSTDEKFRQYGAETFWE